MDTEEKTGQPDTRTLLDHAYDGLLPVSLFCALIGMLLGPLPAVIWTLITGKVFYPLFIAVPLIIYLFTRLLKGCRDIRALIVTAVFSLAGAYLTALSCQSALFVKAYRMSVLNIPLVTMQAVGKSGVLPASATAYVYPLLFTALGVIVAWDLLFLTRNDAQNEGIEN